MKKRILPVVCTVLALLLLVACGGSSGGAGNTDTMSVNFVNGTSYNFNELYVSPAADDYWGEDMLGSTSILKANGNFELALDTYDYDTFDILVVDEDGDKYAFQRVSLSDGAEVLITLDGEPGATVVDADGNESYYSGAFESASGGTGGGTSTAVPTATGTGNDTNGAFSFTIYNESDYDVYAIYMGVANASAEHDFDLLPEILPAHSYTEVSGIVSQGDWLNTEWTLFVQDVDGDWSDTFDVFNPWTVSYVEVYWDTSVGGYVCEFYY